MTWSEAQQRGVVLFAASDGSIRLRPGTLTKSELETLRAHRATIVAEWLWSLNRVPNPIAWDGAIGDALLQLAVAAIGPSAPSLPDRWPEIEAAQCAVDQAWKAEDLPGLVTACHRWVAATCDPGVTDQMSSHVR